jgi:predicted amidohydrolase
MNSEPATATADPAQHLLSTRLGQGVTTALDAGQPGARGFSGSVTPIKQPAVER